MKNLILSFALLMSAGVEASIIEGRLVAKLSGELDPMALGDGCLNIIEYHNVDAEEFQTIGIFQPETQECLSHDTDENEEIDFNLKRLVTIKNKEQLEMLHTLTQDVLKVPGKVRYYRYK